LDDKSGESSPMRQQDYETAFDDAESMPDSPEEDPDFDDNDPKLKEVEAPATQRILRRPTSEDQEIDEEEEEEQQDTEPVSSDSDSDEEAVNELNMITVDLDSNDTWEVVPDTIAWEDIPLLKPGHFSAYEKHADIGLHSTLEFYLEIYIEHGPIQSRKYLYPTDIVQKIREMPNLKVSERNYIPKKFLFNHKHYARILEVLQNGDVELKIHLDNVFVHVVKALAKYNRINNDDNASKTMEDRLRKFERFRDLRGYQKESIVFAITREGRCMLADESGMGKFFQEILVN